MILAAPPAAVLSSPESVATVLLALLMGAGVEAFGAMRWWPLAPVLPMSVLAAVVIFALLRRAGDEPGDEGPGLT